MKVYHSFDEIEYIPNTAITVGTYDGVHLGHRLILKRLLDTAAKEGLRAVAATLDPHPQIVLKKNNLQPVKLLTSIEERLDLFEKLGIQHTLVIPFSYEFSQTTPEEFIRNLIFEKIGLRKIFIGYDHLFGKNREGNSSLLNSLSAELGFDVIKVEPYIEREMVISSTKIRNSILENDMSSANRMLGYSYFVKGTVETGDKRGATIGYPTANVKPLSPYKLMPGNGVYLVSAEVDGEGFFGMANIGTRPTFTESDQVYTEVNLFNFDKDIYGKEITVSFLKFLRREQRFDGLKALLKQLAADKKMCLELIEKFEK